MPQGPFRNSQGAHRWLVLMMFMVAHGVNDGFMWILPPLLPALREYYQLSYTEMGGFYTLYRIVGNVFQAPAAYLVHLAPTSFILVGGLLLSSMGMLAASLCAAYGTLVWFATITGIGRAAYHPLAVTMLSRMFGREAFGRALALHLSGSSVGMVVAPFLVGLLLIPYGWRLPLQVWSALGVLAGLGLFIFLKRQGKNIQPEGKTLSWPFFSPSLGMYLVAAGVWGIAQSGLLAFLPLFLVDYRSFSTASAAAAYGIMSFTGMVCRPFLGALMDRMGRRKPVIVAGFVVNSLSILTIVTSENLLILYGAIVVLGIFGAGHAGLADTLMVEMIPSQRREETLGAVYTVRMSLASLSPLLVGIASEHFSMDASFLMLATTGGLAALLICLVQERPAE